jgi:hypothetical protein
VPGDIGGALFFLDEKARRPAQQVGAVQIFDRVEDARVAHKIGEPGEQQVRFVAQIAGQRPAGRGLEALQPTAIAERLRRRHDPDRSEEALLVKPVDLGLAQQFRHGVTVHSHSDTARPSTKQSPSVGESDGRRLPRCARNDGPFDSDARARRYYTIPTTDTVAGEWAPAAVFIHSWRDRSGGSR